jgi:hypothetical protein
MNDCWVILGIPRTRDTGTVKRAYRDSIKRYHPDTVRSPEKKRHYTIKCVELNNARDEALAYCTAGPDSPLPAVDWPRQRDPDPVRHVSTPLRKFGSVLFTAIVLAFPFLLIIKLPAWMTTLPFDSPVRMVLSGLFVVPLGMAFGGLINIATMLPALYLAAIVEQSPMAKYSFKAAWIVATACQFFVVYYGGYHWPFEHRHDEYYTFLYHTCRFVAWTYVPAYCLGIWMKEYYQYLRVAPHVVGDLAIPGTGEG